MSKILICCTYTENQGCNVKYTPCKYAITTLNLTKKTDNSDFTIFCTKIGPVKYLQELPTWSCKKIFGILLCLVTLLPKTSKEYKLLSILSIHTYFQISCIVKKL